MSLQVDLKKYLPVISEISEIVSGGAIGIDTNAKNFAIENNIKLVEFLPNYKLHGKKAPLERNTQIVQYSDVIYAFWDGRSRGTKDSIDKARILGKKVFVYKKK
jgi:hypothetical protein